MHLELGVGRFEILDEVFYHTFCPDSESVAGLENTDNEKYYSPDCNLTARKKEIVKSPLKSNIYYTSLRRSNMFDKELAN